MEINESSRLRASITTENLPVKILVHQILTPSTSDSNFCAMKRKVRYFFSYYHVVFLCEYYNFFLLNFVCIYNPLTLNDR